MSVQPAQWQWDEQGVPFSLDFKDIYHSRAGGVAQAKEVYVQGCGFPERWANKEACTILETGFGLGLNFLTTWHTWKQAGAPCVLHYLAVERYPLQAKDLSQIWMAYPELAPQANALAAQWILPVSGFHRLIFEEGRVVLTLAIGDVFQVMPEWMAVVDAFYLDGFSPAKNPEMWDIRLFKQCARLAAPGAAVATYTVAGAVRRGLREAGFVVDRVEGFGSKRQRLTGYYQGFPSKKRLSEPEFSRSQQRQRPQKVGVIGAGIAGCSMAERLTARGIQVTLFDAHSEAAQQTSGNRAGVIYPLITKDDSQSSRITRAAYLWWLRSRDGWLQHGMIAGFPGVMQLAKSSAHAAQQEAAIAAHQFPPEYATFETEEAASDKVGYRVGQPGWWFPQGGWVNPLSLCKAMLTMCDQYLDVQWNTRVNAIYPCAEHQGWNIVTQAGIFHADQVVLANAWESACLLPENILDFKRIRGQTHYLMQDALPDLKTVVCQDGYVIPGREGYGCMGATFEWEDSVPLSEEEAYTDNVMRVQGMLPSVSHTDIQSEGGRIGWRTSMQDRLPAAGSFHALLEENMQGIWGVVGLGTRGLVWAPFLAEVVAAQMCGEPLPLERSLLKALAPERFRLRGKR